MDSPTLDILGAYWLLLTITFVQYVLFILSFIWVICTITMTFGHSGRDPDGFFVWKGPPMVNGLPSVKTEKIPCTSVKFSDNGSRLVVTKDTSSASIYDCATFTEIKSFQIPNLLAAVISPLGTYLQTFQKALTSQNKNVSIWKIDTGSVVHQQFQKNMLKTTWFLSIYYFFCDKILLCILGLLVLICFSS